MGSAEAGLFSVQLLMKGPVHQEGLRPAPPLSLSPSMSLAHSLYITR